jgi:protein-S-isoprenylcysteine O-methyltransferase Ste14
VADANVRLARLRVPLGFLAGIIVLALATPTPRALALGTAVALAGQAIRVWAAGHLEKSREVTRSGPYRFNRHPLYVGSSLMGAGVCIAAASLPAAALIALYLATTYTAAIRTEEAFLRGRFGPAYDDYCAGRGPSVDRPFAWERVWRNKEWRSVLGIGIVFLILAAKARWLA